MTDTSGTSVDAAGSAPRGISPYATGGGGVTLERRVAVLYLAQMLVGSTSNELDGRRVERVAFQQAPARDVDDLVVMSRRDDGTDALELDIAVRRAPTFTVSDKHTEKLIGDLLAALDDSPEEGLTRRLAICVAGPQNAAQQVSNLATMARSQSSPSEFFELVRTPSRFRQTLRSRLEHFADLVTANLVAVGVDTSAEATEAATWQLLRHLTILMPRLEAPDETDWSALLSQLEPWAREQTVVAATALRDRLESLAAAYSPAAANVDLVVRS